MHINKELDRWEGLYTSLDFLKINVSSWNMGGVIPMGEELDLKKWLFPFDLGYQPDMFVIGFQEVVPLTAQNIV